MTGSFGTPLGGGGDGSARWYIIKNRADGTVKTRRIMARNDEEETSLALVNPIQGKSTDREKEMFDNIMKAKEFLKIAEGLSDEKVNKMKVSDIGKLVQQASKDITVGKFEQWSKKNIKKDPMLTQWFKSALKFLKSN